MHVQPYYLHSLETSETMLLTLEREERQKRCHDYKAVTGEGVAKGVLDCYGAEERRDLIHPRAEFLLGAARMRTEGRGSVNVDSGLGHAFGASKHCTNKHTAFVHRGSSQTFRDKRSHMVCLQRL